MRCIINETRLNDIFHKIASNNHISNEIIIDKINSHCQIENINQNKLSNIDLITISSELSNEYSRKLIYGLLKELFVEE